MTDANHTTPSTPATPPATPILDSLPMHRELITEAIQIILDDDNQPSTLDAVEEFLEGNQEFLVSVAHGARATRRLQEDTGLLLWPQAVAAAHFRHSLVAHQPLSEEEFLAIVKQVGKRQLVGRTPLGQYQRLVESTPRVSIRTLIKDAINDLASYAPFDFTVEWRR